MTAKARLILATAAFAVTLSACLGVAVPEENKARYGYDAGNGYYGGLDNSYGNGNGYNNGYGNGYGNGYNNGYGNGYNNGYGNEYTKPKPYGGN
ncbi:hypothetical protein LPJ75_005584 [Coemansia sp. RSA 2598]|nr:hypothetical protein LPJ75_005584 [Coemansia sp. RSA 2598]